MDSKEKAMTETKKPDKPASTANQAPTEIGIETFQQLDLRTGNILECRRVKDSDKLLVSQVDLGEERLRSIVSGVAEFYQPEEMVGRNVIIVANLKPVKLRGERSEGMILATDDGEKVKIVEAPADVPPGTVVR